ncbi:MAG: hypothetical protein ACRCYR_11545 [Phycicoccus sp.]
MRATTTVGAVAALVAAALLSGCSFTPDEEPGPTRSGATASSSPTGKTPEQLSAEVLEAAATAAEEARPIGSASGKTRGGTTLTLDVLSIEPVAAGTLVTMRFSGKGSGLAGPAGFADERYDAMSFARTLYLADRTVTKSRYLPLQFEDYREACTCPMFPMELGAEPQTVTALYPPLPDGVTRVDVVANDIVTVKDVPVSR